MSIIDFFGNVIKPKKLRGTGCLNPSESSWINDNILAIRQLDVNIWIIKCGEEFIAFDTGYTNFEGSKTEIIKKGVNPDQIKHVFITHADMDHAGGLISDDVLFKNARVYLHEKEENMLIGAEKRFKFGPIKFRNPISYSGKYELLRDGDKVSIGDSIIEIIHIPGHTPGHSGYLVDGEIFISGDSIAFNEEGGYCFFSFYNMNTEMNLKSLKKLEKRFMGNLPKIVLSGHSGAYSGDKMFSRIDTIAKGTKQKPFDKNAPNDVFNKG